MVTLDIQVTGIEETTASLLAMFSPEQMKRLHREIGFTAKELTADHVGRASVTRHKTADRLGAQPTGYFEFAPGRIGTRDPGPIKAEYTGEGDPATIFDDGGTPESVTISIANCEGILRAYGPVEIKPKKAKVLTIPINAISYGKRARDMENLGYDLFSYRSADGSHPVLMGIKRDEMPVALYALMPHVTLPADPGLMPTDEQFAQWAVDTADAFIEVEKMRS